MKSLKTGLVVLFFIIIFLSFYGAIKILLSIGNSNPVSTNNLQPDVSIKESAGKLRIQTPLQWIKDSQILPQPAKTKQESSEIVASNDSGLQDILNQIQNLTWQDIGIASTSQGKATVNSVNSESINDYSMKILGVWAKNSFTQEEFQLIKKDKDGRALSLEELMQEAISGTNLEELKSSFNAWHMLDERTLSDLKNIPVDSSLTSIHQSMISWFEYHLQVSLKLSQGNLSALEINNLSNQYFEKAKTETPKFQQALMSINKSLTVELIPKAQAQAFYDFGGLIISYADFCTNGFAVIIAGVKGGLLWIYYPTYIANPYLYKVLAPSYYVLGRALWGPGVCNKGYVNYAIGMAQILFFGSSATPL